MADKSEAGRMVLEQIAERCQNAVDANREIDAEIAFTVFGGTSHVSHERNWWIKDAWRPLPKFTSSFDAVMEFLFPDDCTWAGGDLSDENAPWCCITSNTTHEDFSCLSAADFILALCAASLRARAALQSGGGKC